MTFFIEILSSYEELGMLTTIMTTLESIQI